MLIELVYYISNFGFWDGFGSFFLIWGLLFIYVWKERMMVGWLWIGNDFINYCDGDMDCFL